VILVVVVLSLLPAIIGVMKTRKAAGQSGGASSEKS